MKSLYVVDTILYKYYYTIVIIISYLYLWNKVVIGQLIWWCRYISIIDIYLFRCLFFLESEGEILHVQDSSFESDEENCLDFKNKRHIKRLNKSRNYTRSASCSYAVIKKSSLSSILPLSKIMQTLDSDEWNASREEEARKMDISNKQRSNNSPFKSKNDDISENLNKNIPSKSSKDALSDAALR